MEIKTLQLIFWFLCFCCCETFLFINDQYNIDILQYEYWKLLFLYFAHKYLPAMSVASQRQTCPKAPSPNILKNFSRCLGNSHRSVLGSIPQPPSNTPARPLGEPVVGLVEPTAEATAESSTLFTAVDAWYVDCNNARDCEIGSHLILS